MDGHHRKVPCRLTRENPKLTNVTFPSQIKNTMRYPHLVQETLLDAAEKVAEALGV